MAKAYDNLSYQAVPIGTTLPIPITGAPVGYLICDGSRLDRVVYAQLFAAIGLSHGYPDGTGFFIPNYQGVFLRGRAAGNSRDPERASRTFSNSNSNTGDQVGSYQGDDFFSHTHTAPYNGNGTSGQPTVGYAAGDFGVPLGTMRSGNPTGGAETRPKNVYTNYMIRYA